MHVTPPDSPLQRCRDESDGGTKRGDAPKLGCQPLTVAVVKVSGYQKKNAGLCTKARFFSAVICMGGSSI